MNRHVCLLSWSLTLILGACSGDSTEDLADTGAGNADALGTQAQWHCAFDSPFSLEPECKDYTGSGWTEASALADCAVGQYEDPGVFGAGSCSLEPVLGVCDVPADLDAEYRLHLGGANPDFCTLTARACVRFLEAYFTPSVLCADRNVPREPITDEGGIVFQWPTQTCEPALEGEPPGNGPDGDVCTWNLISGCTEEGRSYMDYGSCDIVSTNRVYYPLEGREIAGEDDPRHLDEEYLVESDWVRSQVEACACVCCHTVRAPEGPVKWSVDDGPLWTDGMSDTAIALFAGYNDSSALGAFDPADNNGFNRIDSALPTTDVDRMLGFFQGEFDRREIDPEWARGIRAIGGPLVGQRSYVPEACAEGTGVDASGMLTWSDQQAARYIYVLEQGAENPGIPPNLDLPADTRWRIDVPFDADPLSSGSVQYGEVPEGILQYFPGEQAPAAPLDSGETYYLYVLKDIAVPIARCLFTAP